MDKNKLIRLAESEEGADDNNIVEADNTLEEIRDGVHKALSDRFGGRDRWIQIIQTHIEDPKVVFSMSEDNKIWEIAYIVSDNKEISLIGEKQQVELQPVPIPITMSESMALLEATEVSQGGKWRVALIKAGVSKNGNNYPASVLKKAVPLFEGVRALLRSDEEHLTGKGKSVENLVGVFENVEWDNKRQAIVGDFLISESEEKLKQKLVWAFKEGITDFVGLSIVAFGKGDTEKIGRRLITNVKTIESVESVDIVVDPSAGGEFISMKEASHNNPIEERITMKLAEILKALDKLGKGYKEGVTLEEAQVLLTEAINADEPKATDGVKLANDELNALIEAGKADAEKLKSLTAGVEKTACKTLLDSKLVEAKVSETEMKHFAKFQDVIFVEADLDAQITMLKDMRETYDSTGKVDGCGGGASGMVTEEDKYVESLDDFFMKKTKGIVSYKDLYSRITGDKNVTGRMSECTSMEKYKNMDRYKHLSLHEAMNSSTWAEIQGDSITRAMLADYRRPGLDSWKKFTNIVPTSDFRTQRRIRHGGYTVLNAVAESGTYQDLGNTSDEEATYAVTKRGGLAIVTLEMVKNDDLSQIQAIPRKLSRAAGRTLESFAFTFITGNATIYDSVALFDAAHSNLGTTALSATTLSTNLINMHNQTGFGSSNDELQHEIKFLLIPINLHVIAKKLTVHPTEIGATNAAGTELNVFGDKGIETIIIPNASDTNDWFTIADPLDVPTIEIGFLDGKEEPELFVQDNPTQGSNFSADRLTYKIRHIYSGAVMDFRGFQGNVVA